MNFALMTASMFTVGAITIPPVFAMLALLWLFASQLFGVYGRWTPSKKADQ